MDMEISDKSHWNHSHIEIDKWTLFVTNFIEITAPLQNKSLYILVIIRITMTSQWARWGLKSPASRLFTQPFIQGADQRKHQSSASLAFVRGIHWWPVNSPHKGLVTRNMFPFDDVIMRATSPQCVLAWGTGVVQRWWAIRISRCGGDSAQAPYNSPYDPKITVNL